MADPLDNSSLASAPASAARAGFFAWVVHRPVTTAMLLAGLVLTGAISWRQLPVQLMPDITLPQLSINFRSYSLTLEEIEKKVVQPIEAILAATPRIKDIRSYSSSRSTFFQVQFEFGTDMRFVTLDLQEKLNRFFKSLDSKDFYYYVNTMSSTNWQALFMRLVIQGDANDTSLAEMAETRIVPILEAVNGVAEVNVGGGRWRSVAITFIPEMLEAYGATMESATGQLRKAVSEDFFLGQMQGLSERHFVLLQNRLDSLAKIKRVPIDQSGVATLADVASIEEEEYKSDRIFHYNGKNVVGISITKEASANPLALARRMERAIEDARAQLPEGFDIQIEENVAEVIQTILDEMTNAALLGAALAMGVLFLFLRSFRMSLIVFSAIPVSIIATFNLMYMCGMSINVLTLLGLALGVGLLVDNAIVVLENIFRHYEFHHDPILAAEQGATQVWRALLATTLTNLVVFTPILFAEGNLRLIFREGAMAVIFPQLMSLLVALTLVPMLTARMLMLDRNPSLKKESNLGRWKRRLRQLARRRNPYWPAYRQRPRVLHREIYGALLRATLRHRVRTCVGIALVLLLTWHIALPKIQPDVMNDDPRQQRVYFFLKTASDDDVTELERAVFEAEKAIAALPYVKTFTSSGEPERGAMVSIDLKDLNEIGKTRDQILSELLDDIGPVPGAQTSLAPFRAEEGRSSIALRRAGEIEILGPDNNTIQRIGDTVAAQLEALPQIARTQMEMNDDSSGELHFILDPERAAILQISPSDVASVIRKTTRSGESSSLYLKQGDSKISIQLRAGDIPYPLPFSEIENLPVRGREGQMARLKDIGYFTTANSERRLVRHNMQRVVDMDYFLEPGESEKDANQAVQNYIDNARMPVGVTIRIGGRYREAQENTAEFKWMIALTFLLIYMVLASIFESLMTPVVIMTTLPLAGLGVIWAMAFFGVTANEQANFGVLILLGIVVNNGIVLLDFISVARRERNCRRTRAVVVGCYTRLRPILMTSLTTMLGLLPMAMKHNEGFDGAGLAIVIIAGLLTSTVLTLFILPAMLMNFEDVAGLLARIASWTARMTAAPAYRLGKGAFLAGVDALRRPIRALEAAPALADGAGGPAIALRASGEAADFRAGPHGGAGSAEGARAGIVARQICMTYPLFSVGQLARIVPSLRYKYGGRPPSGVEALRNVSFRLEPGMCGLLGPNGAGKTTLMQILSGVLAPTRGYVEIAGVNLAREREAGRARAGYLPQRFGLPDEFTAREFLDFHAALMGTPDAAERRAQVERALETVNLAEAANRRIGGFSGGMRRRLGIARLLLRLPDVLIVDEPTAGLDPVERAKFRNLLSRLAAERTVLFSTHILEDISASCSRLLVLDRGALAYDGPVQEMAALADGMVWEWSGSAPEAHGERAFILRQRAAEQGIRYRVLCRRRPHPSAAAVRPSVEDAYMAIVLGMLDAQ